MGHQNEATSLDGDGLQKLDRICPDNQAGYASFITLAEFILGGMAL